VSVSIERASVDADVSKQLMAELWAEVDELYENDVPSRSELAGMDQPRAFFVIARDEGKPIGCGAIRPLRDDMAEVKRVYVRPHSRRTGAARAIMATLEQLARDAGFNEIWLETGQRQPAAIRLYESLGYTRIAAFGDYKDDPVSICYGKRLTALPPSDREKDAVN